MGIKDELRDRLFGVQLDRFRAVKVSFWRSGLMRMAYSSGLTSLGSFPGVVAKSNLDSAGIVEHARETRKQDEDAQGNR